MKIQHLTDKQRYETADAFLPLAIEVRSTEKTIPESRKPTKRERDAIRGYLRGALLTLGFDDNEYTSMRQVAYAMECAASYNPALENINTYTAVFCPIMRMLDTVRIREEAR